MIVLPVLDLLDGRVVRGIAGRRDEYRPIVSSLTASNDAFDVVRAIRDRFDLNRFYVADLDGILKQQPNLSLLEQLIASDVELLVDSGVANSADAQTLLKVGVTRVIVGLESCRTPDDLAAVTGTVNDVTFSLDLMNGVPRLPHASTGWSERSQEIIRQAVLTNIRAILPLDLADVGTATGGSTDSLCQFIRHEFPQMEVIAGGGVRGIDDLKRFHSLEVNAVLVASALHDGRLSREDVHAFE